MEEIDDKCTVGYAAYALLPDWILGNGNELDGKEAEKEQHRTHDAGSIGKHGSSVNLLAKQRERVGQTRDGGKDGARFEWHPTNPGEPGQRGDSEPEDQNCECSPACASAPNAMISIVHPGSQPPEGQQEHD